MVKDISLAEHIEEFIGCDFVVPVSVAVQELSDGSVSKEMPIKHRASRQTVHG